MGDRSTRHRAMACAAAFAGLAAAGGLAFAGPVPVARLAWSTYLRAGPGQTFKALDELDHGTPLVIADCGARWCRVTADGLEGYVDRDAVALAAPPAPRAGAGDCAIVGQAGSRRPEATRFCTPAPAPAPLVR